MREIVDSHCVYEGDGRFSHKLNVALNCELM